MNYLNTVQARIILALFIGSAIGFSCKQKRSYRSEMLLSNGNTLIRIISDSNKLIKEFEVNNENHLDGPYKEFFENGNIKYEYNYSNDYLSGVQKQFIKNGNIYSFSNYNSNSKLDSIQCWYYDNEILKAQLFWIDGKQFGIQKLYSESGYLENIYFMIGDSSKSADIQFDKNGSITNYEGRLLNCIYDKNEVVKGDTLRALFYAIIPENYSYISEIKEERSGIGTWSKKIEFTTINNNNGYLLERVFKNKGQYLLKFYIILKSKTSNQILKDTLVLPLQVN